ncbi:MAG: hypothetical protein RLZZ450_2215 [Pseudomonadota bacterium]|jgi:glutathione S-transferase
MLELVGSNQSPWTQKARWALEACSVECVFTPYIPTLSELALRRRLGQWRGPVHVPVLFEGKRAIAGATEIAVEASSRAHGRLGDFVAAAPWLALSDSALAEGRARVLATYLGDDEAQREQVPSFVPDSMRGSLRFLARDAIRRVERKYAASVTPGALVDALDRTRAGLADTASDYLLGSFSYADIAMATVLEVVCPIAVSHPPQGPRTTAAWTVPALIERYGDLLSWRERLVRATQPSFLQRR